MNINVKTLIKRRERFYSSRGRGRFTKGRNYNVVSIQAGSKPKHINTPSKGSNTSSSSIYWQTTSSSNQDTSTISEVESTLILAISEGRGEASYEVGIAAIDLSHPSVILCQIADSQSYVRTLTKINVLNPAEILLPATFVDNERSKRLCDKIKEKFPYVKMTGLGRYLFNSNTGMEYIRDLCAKAYDSVILILQHRHYALTAASALLYYIETTHLIYYANQSLKVEYQEIEGVTLIDLIHSNKLTHPPKLLLDITTADRLELVSSNHPAAPVKESSLFGIMNHCATRVGTRLLRSTLLQPPCDISEILARLNCVTEFVKKSEMIETIQSILSRVKNIDQLLSISSLLRDSTDKGSERQLNYLLLLNSLLDILQPLQDVLQNSKQGFFIEIRQTLSSENFVRIKTLVRKVIHEDARPAKGTPGIMQRCFSIKPGINGLLDLMRKNYSEKLDELRDYVNQLGEKYSLSLNLGSNNKKGYHIILNLSTQERKTFKRSQLPNEFIQVDRMATCFTMKTMDLINYSSAIDDTTVEILKLSNKIVLKLLQSLKEEMSLFYKLCEQIAKLDMLQSIAIASKNPYYIRPKFGAFTEVTHSKHPLLDFLLHKEPVRNSFLATEDHNFHIITGANGSGKSIFIRQIVLLQIMAQVSCYVPAFTATFRVSDRILARIDLGDNMQLGVSAFVLELKEIQYFLNVMTNNTLIIVDELCRSTSLEEGAALAMAICEKLLHTKAFSFVTTHFTLSTKLADMYYNVKAWQLHTTQTVKPNGKISLNFKYSVLPGIASLENCAIHVARSCWTEDVMNMVEEEMAQTQHTSVANIKSIKLDTKRRMKYDLEADLKLFKMKGQLTKQVIAEKLATYISNLRDYNIHIEVSDIFEYKNPSRSSSAKIVELSENQTTLGTSSDFPTGQTFSSQTTTSETSGNDFVQQYNTNEQQFIQPEAVYIQSSSTVSNHQAIMRKNPLNISYSSTGSSENNSELNISNLTFNAYNNEEEQKSHVFKMNRSLNINQNNYLELPHSQQQSSFVREGQNEEFALPQSNLKANEDNYLNFEGQQFQLKINSNIQIPPDDNYDKVSQLSFIFKKPEHPVSQSLKGSQYILPRQTFDGTLNSNFLLLHSNSKSSSEGIPFGSQSNPYEHSLNLKNISQNLQENNQSIEYNYQNQENNKSIEYNYQNQKPLFRSFQNTLAHINEYDNFTHLSRSNKEDLPEPNHFEDQHQKLNSKSYSISENGEREKRVLQDTSYTTVSENQFLMPLQVHLDKSSTPIIKRTIFSEPFQRTLPERDDIKKIHSEPLYSRSTEITPTFVNNQSFHKKFEEGQKGTKKFKPPIPERKLIKKLSDVTILPPISNHSANTQQHLIDFEKKNIDLIPQNDEKSRNIPIEINSSVESSRFSKPIDFVGKPKNIVESSFSSTSDDILLSQICEEVESVSEYLTQGSESWGAGATSMDSMQKKPYKKKRKEKHGKNEDFKRKREESTFSRHTSNSYESRHFSHERIHFESARKISPVSCKAPISSKIEECSVYVARDASNAIDPNNSDNSISYSPLDESKNSFFITGDEDLKPTQIQTNPCDKIKTTEDTINLTENKKEESTEIISCNADFKKNYLSAFADRRKNVHQHYNFSCNLMNENNKSLNTLKTQDYNYMQKQYIPKEENKIKEQRKTECQNEVVSCESKHDTSSIEDTIECTPEFSSKANRYSLLKQTQSSSNQNIKHLQELRDKVNTNNSIFECETQKLFLDKKEQLKSGTPTKNSQIQKNSILLARTDLSTDDIFNESTQGNVTNCEVVPNFEEVNTSANLKTKENKSKVKVDISKFIENNEENNDAELTDKVNKISNIGTKRKPNHGFYPKVLKSSKTISRVSSYKSDCDMFSQNTYLLFSQELKKGLDREDSPQNSKFKRRKSEDIQVNETTKNVQQKSLNVKIQHSDIPIFVAPKTLTKKEIEECYSKQNQKVMESSEEDLEKNYRLISNRPSVKQVQQLEHLAVIRKTDEGVVVYNVQERKVKQRKFLPPLKGAALTDFDVSLFSDKNADAFNEFLQSSSSNSTVCKLNSEIMQSKVFHKASKTPNNDTLTKKGELDDSTDGILPPSSYYKQNKEMINSIVTKYLNTNVADANTSKPIGTKHKKLNINDKNPNKPSSLKNNNKNPFDKNSSMSDLSF